MITGNINILILFLYLNKKLDLTAFVDNVYSIENINQAILDLSQGRVLRPIIEFN